MMYGQVAAGNWNEPGDVMGIQLNVAKNATAFYMSWWYIQRVADFNYSAFVNESDYHDQLLCTLVDPVCSFDYADSTACYILPTYEAEEICLATTSSSTLVTGEIVGIVFGVFAALLLGFGIAYMCLRRPPPLASKMTDSVNNNL